MNALRMFLAMLLEDVEEFAPWALEALAFVSCGLALILVLWLLS